MNDSYAPLTDDELRERGLEPEPGGGIRAATPEMRVRLDEAEARRVERSRPIQERIETLNTSSPDRGGGPAQDNAPKDDVLGRALRIAESITPNDASPNGRAHDGMFESGRFVPPVLGRAAEQELNLRIGPGRSLWHYDGGLYLPNGDERLAAFVREALTDGFRDNHLREVRSWCNANSAAKLPTQPATDYINVANGILHWREDPPRLEPHSPDVPSIMQVSAEWDPEAECPRIRKFLRRILPEHESAECMTFLFEWIGYLLVPTAKMQRALMLLGPGDSGKSTVLRLIGSLVGKSNVSHHSLQSICDNRFTAADLYGRLANICADLDAKSISNSGNFKMIVAGDPMSVEHKYQRPFKYEPYARLIFSANEAPGTSDQTDAYYKRWLILLLTRKLPKEQQNPDLIEGMTTPDELAGLLKYAVAALRLLWRRGRFDEPEVMRLAAAKYRADTDTVVAFVEARCTFGTNERVGLTPMFNDYRDWCSKNNRRELGMQRFKEHLLSTYPVLDVRKLHGVNTVHGTHLESETS